MSGPYFGYSWFGCWDARGANEVKELKSFFVEASLTEYVNFLPDLSAASPQHVNVLRTIMLDEKPADELNGIEWSLHPDTNPKGGHTFLALRAIAGDRDTAKKWIDTVEGRIWRTGALAFALISVKTN